MKLGRAEDRYSKEDWHNILVAGLLAVTGAEVLIDVDIPATLFEYFAPGGILEGFARVEPASRNVPAAVTIDPCVRLEPFGEKLVFEGLVLDFLDLDAAFVDHEDLPLAVDDKGAGSEPGQAPRADTFLRSGAGEDFGNAVFFCPPLNVGSEAGAMGLRDCDFEFGHFIRPPFLDYSAPLAEAGRGGNHLSSVNVLAGQVDSREFLGICFITCRQKLVHFVPRVDCYHCSTGYAFCQGVAGAGRSGYFGGGMRDMV